MLHNYSIIAIYYFLILVTNIPGHMPQTDYYEIILKAIKENDIQIDLFELHIQIELRD